MAICLKIVRIIHHDFQIQAPENQGCFKAIVVRANISQPIKVELVAGVNLFCLLSWLEVNIWIIFFYIVHPFRYFSIIWIMFGITISGLSGWARSDYVVVKYQELS